jgi:hydroxymethylbilane synthase
LTLSLTTYKTQGDLVLDTSLSQVGDKGLFVKELEVALLQGEIDIAIHSLKDMPGEQPAGLALQSIGEREDPRDVLITPGHILFQFLPEAAVVGTSSLRRIAQFKRLRGDVSYETIRGNLNTRLKKMEDGLYQGIILAAAGVHRLGWATRIAQYFDPVEQCIPAVGQGILAVEFRQDDARVAEWLMPLEVSQVNTVMMAERAFLKTLQGGCQVPLGAYAKPMPEDSGAFMLHGIILDLEGVRYYRASQPFKAETALTVGTAMAHQLMDAGGRDVLAELALR